MTGEMSQKTSWKKQEAKVELKRSWPKTKTEAEAYYKEKGFCE